MGWFWGSNDNTSKGDAYKNLDPKLREFLDKESPTNHTPTASKPASPPTPSPDGASNTFRSQVGLIGPSVSQSHQNSAAQVPTSQVPTESLYQDGRYAHLWSTYRPQSATEAAQTDQDKLASVIDAYKDRQARLARAAVENCVFEQLGEHECFRTGGWYAKMSMCRDETRKFNRCYTMQARFLKALGYLSPGRSEDQDEQIQMHADKLFGEMMEREKISNEAREKGLPEPDWRPLMGGSGTGLEIFTEERRRVIEEGLKGKTKAEREFEIQMRVAEARAGEEYGLKIEAVFDEERARRADRRERGKATVVG